MAPHSQVNYAAEYEEWVHRYAPQPSELRETSRTGEARPPVSESFLRCLWYDQLFIPRLLASEGGDRIVVEFPGFWNVGPGPDFTQARLRIGERQVTGDVELHLRAGDWKTHGHGADKAYNGVVLHAALWRGSGSSPPRNFSDKAIPQAILEECLVRPLEDLVGEIDPEHYPGRSPSALGFCHPHIADAGPARKKMMDWISKAADARFETKIRRAQRWIGESASLSEAFVCSWVENWGFGGFRETYLHAALACRNVGLRALMEGGPLPAEERTERLLMGALRSGLDGSPRRSARPSLSHPRRVAFITHTLLTLFLDRGWLVLEQMIRALDPAESPRKGLQRLREGLGMLIPRPAKCALLQSVSRHGISAPRIGADTRDILLLNFLLPFASAWARHENSIEREKAAHALFEVTPRLPENRIERAAVRRMFGSSLTRGGRSLRTPAAKGNPLLRSARFQQGLHRIYEDFCSKGLDGCERCPIPSSLMEIARS
ncbi:MAG: DUF2851 family protein [Nitrospirae bacterium]|nr:DUF2851 family protein [Nitrospirota bacterium]